MSKKESISVFLYKALRPYKRTGIFVRSIMSTLVLSRGIWWCALLTRSSCGETFSFYHKVL